MTRYRVYLSTTAHAGVTVEADDEQAAIEAAFDIVPPEVCAQCSGWNDNYDLELAEWQIDGETSVELADDQ